MKARILRLLRSDSEGQTAEELAAVLGEPLADVRVSLSALVFDDREITCSSDGLYTVGAPPAEWPQPQAA